VATSQAIASPNKEALGASMSGASCFVEKSEVKVGRSGKIGTTEKRAFLALLRVSINKPV
jgi:hypothetical protein